MKSGKQEAFSEWTKASRLSKSDERKVRRPMGRMGWSGRVRGMKITIVGRKVNLRNNFKELAERKLSKFNRIFDEDAEATVTVTVERNRQTVEITIKQRGMIYRAEETSLEMNAALDHVISALGRQLRRYKTRQEKAK